MQEGGWAYMSKNNTLKTSKMTIDRSYSIKGTGYVLSVLNDNTIDM